MRYLLIAITAAAALATLPPPAVAGPLVTGVADAGLDEADGAVLAERIRDAGGTAVRMWLSWRSVAPAGPTKPAGFDARNHADPAYDWSSSDQQVRVAKAAGLEPIVVVSTAPEWAERKRPEDASLPAGERRPGTLRPDPAELEAFAEAVARRYSGRSADLPRVRWWQAWNEPNHHNDLNPQFDVAPGEPATSRSPILSADAYRDMLIAFTTAVHRVHADNVVVAGGLAPFFRPSPGGRAAAPLPFMRRLLCLSRRNRPLSNCGPPLRFDAWSQHPYTSGDADHSANSPDDVSLGDLPEVRKVLRAAVKARRLVPRRPVRMWVTEFSWDSNPPDPHGVPDKLLTRWVAEALNRMWKHGVGLVTWFQVRDQVAPPQGVFQSGLFLRCDGGVACDRPKPMLQAFRFPFVAYRSGRRVRVWSKTPYGRRGTVLIEQRRGARWVRLARVRTDRHGILETRVPRRGSGDLRARLSGSSAASPAFSLKRVPDRPVNPFGNNPVDEP